MRVITFASAALAMGHGSEGMADSNQSSAFGSTSLVVRAAAMVVLLGALKLATQLVVPLLLAAFLAIASAPVMFWLIRRGVNRFIAVSAAVLADVAFFGAMGALSARGLDAFVSAVPRYQARVEVLREEISLWLVGQGLPDLGELLPSTMRGESARQIVTTAFTEVFSALSLLALVIAIGFVVDEISC